MKLASVLVENGYIPQTFDRILRDEKIREISRAASGSVCGVEAPLATSSGTTACVAASCLGMRLKVK
jgi:hypothetical protein